MGLGSVWALQAYFELIEAVSDDKPTNVLAHKPDVANFYPLPAFLTLTDHTRGGLVNLPMITQGVLNDITMAGVNQGWYRTPGGAMFVTGGVGMVGLSVGFASVPVIDVIEFSPRAVMPGMQNAMVLKGRFRGW